MRQLILATNNLGKIKELQSLVAPIECIAQSSLGIHAIEETGLSFIENAIIKARHASFHANAPALADDSGLVVPSLNGQPGIYSARFAGLGAQDEDNIALLLEKLANTQDKQAYFYCAMALVSHATDPTPIIAVGQINGKIQMTCAGEHGFGYDPIFYLPDYQCTMAQLPLAIKNSISHRALALNELKKHLGVL